MIKIPLETLSAAALEGVVEEYIMREGTDYGPRTYTLVDKRAQVMAALESGRAVITFDPVTGTTTIIAEDELPRADG